jgi:hypothetical protein
MSEGDVKVEDIADFPLSHVILSYYVCQNCRVVDRDMNRAADGYPCSRCGAPSSGAHSYFPFSVPTLVDLIQHHYHW